MRRGSVVGFFVSGFDLGYASSTQGSEVGQDLLIDALRNLVLGQLGLGEGFSQSVDYLALELSLPPPVRYLELLELLLQLRELVLLLLASALLPGLPLLGDLPGE